MNLSVKLEKSLCEFIKIFAHFILPVNCPVCGRPGEIICRECAFRLFNEKIITKKIENLEINSAAWYHTDINKLIADFKYAGNKALCRPLGRAMAQFFHKPDADFLLPVPLHVNSKRNYNQALELAKGMNEIWNMKIFHGAKWAKVMPHRAGMNFAERMKLTSDAFIISDDIKGFDIAVIDDVCTTGLTLLKFAEACGRKGAKVIGAYTLAAVSEE